MIRHARWGRLAALLLLLTAAACRCDRTDEEENGEGPDPDAPVVTILAPADGAILEGAGPFVLEGEAHEPSGEALTGDALVWSSSVDGVLGTGTEIAVHLSEGSHTLTLEAEGATGVTASDSIAVTVVLERGPPTVTILAPDEGASFVEGETITLSGQAFDPVDGELSGGALTWTSSREGRLGNGRTLEWPEPELGVHRVTLTAVSDAGLSGTAHVEIEVFGAGQNRPPRATIHAPEDAATFVAGTPIAFSGSADDPEDGALDGDALVWSSNLDGVIGSGGAFERSDLSAGVHGITLAATDRDGATGTAEVSIAVNPPGNAPPSVTIVSPADGASFQTTDAVELVGEAVDPEDGALPGDALSWASSLDGSLGAGSPLSVSLSEGLHRITLSATDSGGATGLARIDLRILPPNEPPVVTILSPPDGSTFEAGTTITFTGEAIDPEDGLLEGSTLTWLSSADGTIGTGTSLAYASLTPGSHRITLTAVDSDGAVGTDGIDLTITDSGTRLPPVARLTGPSTALVGHSVTFDGSDSTAPSGEIVSYRFDFGDGTPAVIGSDATVAHVYDAPGPFTVTLTVTDDADATHQATHALEVREPVRVPEIVAETEGVTYGTRCDLAIDGQDDLHVVFRNVTHPSIWYARWSGSAWQVEMIDGMGFGVGGRVGGAMSIVTDASGNPHVAYFIDGRLSYATRSGSGPWTIEQVDTAIPATTTTSRPPAIALDPASGNRPTLVYSQSATPGNPVIAYRTGPGAWTNVAAPAGTGDPWRFVYTTGGLVFDGGTAYFTARDSSNLGTLGTWSASAGFSDPEIYRPVPVSNAQARITLDSAGSPIVVDPYGAHQRSDDGWVHSHVEGFSLSHFALAYDEALGLVMAWGHDATLEIVRAHAGEFWERTYHGPMDSTDIGIGVDAEAQVRACFFRSGRLMVY